MQIITAPGGIDFRGLSSSPLQQQIVELQTAFMVEKDKGKALMIVNDLSTTLLAEDNKPPRYIFNRLNHAIHHDKVSTFSDSLDELRDWGKASSSPSKHKELEESIRLALIYIKANAHGDARGEISSIVKQIRHTPWSDMGKEILRSDLDPKVLIKLKRAIDDDKSSSSIVDRAAKLEQMWSKNAPKDECIKEALKLKDQMGLSGRGDIEIIDYIIKVMGDFGRQNLSLALKDLKKSLVNGCVVKFGSEEVK